MDTPDFALSRVNRYLSSASKVGCVLLIGVICLAFSGCDNFLVEEVHTQYDPEELLQTEDGIRSVLYGAYSELQILNYPMRDVFFTFSEFPTDIALESGGGFESHAVQYINYQWDPSQGLLVGQWARWYRAIRNANSLLDNIDKVANLPAERLAMLRAEARFIRAASYYRLWEFFGTVPLITTTESLAQEPPRASEDELLQFLATELREAANDLPLTQDQYGRATKGAALGLLTSFYLNTSQWQESADAAQEIIDLNQYSLFDEIEHLFSVENEGNSEIIYVHPTVVQEQGNVYMSHAFPPNYPIQPNWINFGAQFRTYTSFIRSFHPDDRRLRMFLTEYTDTHGVHHNLVEDEDGNPLDNARSFKYTPDPNASGPAHGNDAPIIRYSEILLARAEALNELEGPSSESIDLINQVRERADVPPLQLSDLPSQEALRNHILAERGWEFFSEGKRRMDLIRHGKLISDAQERGKNAQSHHVLYPIPQREIDANPNLEQNPGY